MVVNAQLDGTAAPGSYDTVVLLNVLEHIPDDHQALGDIYESLAPGGKVVLWVPAFEALYGKFDQRIGHYRRYRRNELLALVHKVGFQQVTARVQQLAGLLRLVVGRSRPSAHTHRQAVSPRSTTDTSSRSSVESSAVVRPPFGQSLLVVAQRS